MEKPVHKWFIEPLDSKTNEVLARNQQFLCEEQTLDGVWCSDGKTHKLWGCKDYGFVNKMRNSRVDLRLKFKVWHQQSQGQIREWVFPNKKPNFSQLMKKMSRRKMVNQKP